MPVVSKDVADARSVQLMVTESFEEVDSDNRYNNDGTFDVYRAMMDRQTVCMKIVQDAFEKTHVMGNLAAGKPNKDLKSQQLAIDIVSKCSAAAIEIVAISKEESRKNSGPLTTTVNQFLNMFQNPVDIADAAASKCAIALHAYNQHTNKASHCNPDTLSSGLRDFKRYAEDLL